MKRELLLALRWAIFGALVVGAVMVLSGCRTVNPWDTAPWHYGYVPQGEDN